MKRSPWILLLLMLIATLASPLAEAHGRGRVGVFIGAPLGWPGWYYPPPYYYSPPLVVEAPPRTYIERSPVKDEDDEPYYWYYCDKPKGYHPYVEKCPGGWKKVVPTPPTD